MTPMMMMDQRQEQQPSSNDLSFPHATTRKSAQHDQDGMEGDDEEVLPTCPSTSSTFATARAKKRALEQQLAATLVRTRPQQQQNQETGHLEAIASSAVVTSTKRRPMNETLTGGGGGGVVSSRSTISTSPARFTTDPMSPTSTAASARARQRALEQKFAKQRQQIGLLDVTEASGGKDAEVGVMEEEADDNDDALPIMPTTTTTTTTTTSSSVGGSKVGYGGRVVEEEDENDLTLPSIPATAAGNPFMPKNLFPTGGLEREEADENDDALPIMPATTATTNSTVGGSKVGYGGRVVEEEDENDLTLPSIPATAAGNPFVTKHLVSTGGVEKDEEADENDDALPIMPATTATTNSSVGGSKVGYDDRVVEEEDENDVTLPSIPATAIGNPFVTANLVSTCGVEKDEEADENDDALPIIPATTATTNSSVGGSKVGYDDKVVEEEDENDVTLPSIPATAIGNPFVGGNAGEDEQVENDRISTIAATMASNHPLKEGAKVGNESRGVREEEGENNTISTIPATMAINPFTNILAEHPQQRATMASNPFTNILAEHPQERATIASNPFTNILAEHHQQRKHTNSSSREASISSTTENSTRKEKEEIVSEDVPPRRHIRFSKLQPPSIGDDTPSRSIIPSHLPHSSSSTSTTKTKPGNIVLKDPTQGVFFEAPQQSKQHAHENGTLNRQPKRKSTARELLLFQAIAPSLLAQQIEKVVDDNDAPASDPTKVQQAEQQRDSSNEDIESSSFRRKLSFSKQRSVPSFAGRQSTSRIKRSLFQKQTSTPDVRTNQQEEVSSRQEHPSSLRPTPRYSHTSRTLSTNSASTLGSPPTMPDAATAAASKHHPQQESQSRDRQSMFLKSKSMKPRRLIRWIGGNVVGHKSNTSNKNFGNNDAVVDDGIQVVPLKAKKRGNEIAIVACGSFFDRQDYFYAEKGVSRVICGYTGGNHPSPTFHNKQDHTEAIFIEFNPKHLTFNELLVVWMHTHNPFEPETLHYRSALFPISKEQNEVVDKYLVMVQYLRPRDRLYVHVETATTFYQAEGRHQKVSERKSRQKKQPRGEVEGVWRDVEDGVALPSHKELAHGHEGSSVMVDSSTPQDKNSNDGPVSIMKANDGRVSVSGAVTDNNHPAPLIKKRSSVVAAVFGGGGGPMMMEDEPSRTNNNTKGRRRSVSRNGWGKPSTKEPRRVSSTESTAMMMDQLLQIK